MDKQQILKLRKLNTEAADLRKRIKDFESKPREYVAERAKLRVQLKDIPRGLSQEAREKFEEIEGKRL